MPKIKTIDEKIIDSLCEHIYYLGGRNNISSVIEGWRKTMSERELMYSLKTLLKLKDNKEQNIASKYLDSW